MPSGTITWIDTDRGCCFISTGVRSRDLYADVRELDSPGLRVGAAVEFAVRRAMRGRLRVTDVVVREPAAGPGPARRGPIEAPARTAGGVALDVWEGEGGSLE